MKYLSFLILIVCCFPMSQNEFFDNLDLVKKVANPKGLEFLMKNEKSMCRDPEFTVLYLNYAFSKVMADLDLGKKDQFRQGPLSTKDKVTNVQEYVKLRFGAGKHIIEKSIFFGFNNLTNFEKRMDIRLGLIAAARFVADPVYYGLMMRDLLSLHVKWSTNWTWGYVNDDDMKWLLRDPDAFIIENISTHIGFLYQLEDDVADNEILLTAEKLIEIFPKKVNGYAFKGLYYTGKKNWKEAKIWYQAGLKVAPHDEICKKNLEKIEQNLLKKP